MSEAKIRVWEPMYALLDKEGLTKNILNNVTRNEISKTARINELKVRYHKIKKLWKKI